MPMSYSTAQHSEAGSTESSTGVVERLRHKIGQLVTSHPVGVRLAYVELVLLAVGAGLALLRVGAEPTGTSLAEVFATLSFVSAMTLAVVAAVGAVAVGAFEGYRSLRHRTA
jgi:hypothetical protein